MHQEALGPSASSLRKASPFHHDYRAYCSPFPSSAFVSVDGEGSTADVHPTHPSSCRNWGSGVESSSMIHHDTLAAAVDSYSAFSFPFPNSHRVPMVIRGSTVKKERSVPKSTSPSAASCASSHSKKKERLTVTRKKGEGNRKSSTLAVGRNDKEESMTALTSCVRMGLSSTCMTKIMDCSPTNLRRKGSKTGKGARSSSSKEKKKAVAAAPVPATSATTTMASSSDYHLANRQRERRVLLLKDALRTALHRLLHQEHPSSSVMPSVALPYADLLNHANRSMVSSAPPSSTRSLSASFPFSSFPMGSHIIHGVPNHPSWKGTDGRKGKTQRTTQRAATPPPKSVTPLSSFSTATAFLESQIGGSTGGVGGEGMMFAACPSLFRVTPPRLARGRGGRGGGGRGRGGGSRSSSGAATTTAAGSPSSTNRSPNTASALKRSTRRQSAANSSEEEDGITMEDGGDHTDEGAIAFSSSGQKGVAESVKGEEQSPTAGDGEADDEVVPGAPRARLEEEEEGEAVTEERERRGEDLNSGAHDVSNLSSSVTVRRHDSVSLRSDGKGAGQISWQDRYHTPDDCPVEAVLLDGLTPLPRLPELIHRVADPIAAPIEDVSLFDFCAMIPSRQRHAVHQREDWLEAVYRSVQCQAVQDVRQLQLAGLHSIGRWEEYRDRGMVRLTPYSRGRLESAYRYLIGLKKDKGEQMVVLTWLQKAIQRAIAEEFQSAALGTGISASGGPWKSIASGLANNATLSLTGGSGTLGYPSLALAAPPFSTSTSTEESNGNSPYHHPHPPGEVASSPSSPPQRDHLHGSGAPVSSSLGNQLTDESELEAIESLNSKLLWEKGKKGVGSPPPSAKKDHNEEEKKEVKMGTAKGEVHATSLESGEPVEEVEEEENEEGEMTTTKKKVGSSRKAVSEEEEALVDDGEDNVQVEGSTEEETSVSEKKRRKKSTECSQGDEEPESAPLDMDEESFKGKIAPEPVEVEEEVVVEEVEEIEEEMEEGHTRDEEKNLSGTRASEEGMEREGEEDEEEQAGRKGTAYKKGSIESSSNSTAATSAEKYPPPKKEEAALLNRLGELMITQVNSADGFLHGAKRELKGDERKGLTEILDDDTAIVKAENMFRLLHTHSFHPLDSQAVKVLKQMCGQYHHHQTEMEKAAQSASAASARKITTDEKKQRKIRLAYFQLAGFHQQKSVDALVFGVTLLKAIAREESIYMNPGLTPPPLFGFPLLSSNAGPLTFSTSPLITTEESTSSSERASNAVTTMTDQNVLDATRLYAEYLSDPTRRATPLCPSIARNVGCSIIAIVQSTIHLYETSLKTRVEEEQIRMEFASALLGALHVLQQDILPRINTISYHILATATPSTGGGGGGIPDDEGRGSSSSFIDGEDEDALTPTNIVSIDLAGPFSVAEKKWLAALALPLGLAEEVENTWHCLEDVILSVESHTGATVEHDVIVSKDDVEAFLTPTLAPLLPEEAPHHSEMSLLLEQEEEEEKKTGGRGSGKGRKGKLAAVCTSTSFIPPFVPQFVRRLPIPEGSAGGAVPPAPSIGEEVENMEEGEEEHLSSASDPATTSALPGEEVEGEAEEQEEIEAVEVVENEEEEGDVEGKGMTETSEEVEGEGDDQEEVEEVEEVEEEVMEDDEDQGMEEAAPAAGKAKGKVGVSSSAASMWSSSARKGGGIRHQQEEEEDGEAHAEEDEVEQSETVHCVTRGTEGGAEEGVDSIAAASGLGSSSATSSPSSPGRRNKRATHAGVVLGGDSGGAGTTAAADVNGARSLKNKRASSLMEEEEEEEVVEAHHHSQLRQYPAHDTMEERHNLKEEEEVEEEEVEEEEEEEMVVPVPAPLKSSSAHVLASQEGGILRRRDVNPFEGGPRKIGGGPIPATTHPSPSSPTRKVNAAPSHRTGTSFSASSRPAVRVQEEEEMEEMDQEEMEREEVRGLQRREGVLPTPPAVKARVKPLPIPSATTPAPTSSMPFKKVTPTSTGSTTAHVGLNKTSLSQPTRRPVVPASLPSAEAAPPPRTPLGAAGATAHSSQRPSSPAASTPISSFSSSRSFSGMSGVGPSTPKPAPPPPAPSSFAAVTPPRPSSTEPLLLKKKKKKVMIRYHSPSSTTSTEVKSSPLSSNGRRTSESTTDQWFRRPAVGSASALPSTRLNAGTGMNYGMRK